MFFKITKEKIEKWEKENNVKKLIKALRTDDKSILLLVIDSLIKIGDKKVLEPLIKLLYDKNKDIRIKAMNGLGKIGVTQAVVPLIKFLNDNDEDIQKIAIEVIAQVGDSKAVESLIQLLENTKKDTGKQNIRIIAFEALKRIGNKETNIALEEIRKEQELVVEEINIASGSQRDSLALLISDQSILYKLIMELKLRENFIWKIKDQKLLADICKNCSLSNSKQEAVKYINDVNFLENLLKESTDHLIKNEIRRRLTMLEQNNYNIKNKNINNQNYEIEDILNAKSESWNYNISDRDRINERTGKCKDCGKIYHLFKSVEMMDDWLDNDYYEDFHYAYFYYCPICNPYPNLKNSFSKGQLCGIDNKQIVDQVRQLKKLV